VHNTVIDISDVLCFAAYLADYDRKGMIEICCIVLKPGALNTVCTYLMYRAMKLLSTDGS